MSDRPANSSPAETLTDASQSDVSAASPPEQTPADTQAPAPLGETPTAATPAAPEKDERTALLEVVQKVVKADPKTSPQSDGQAAQPGQVPTTDQAQTQTPAPGDAAAAEADPTDDELKALTPKTRRRVEQLLRQRRDARSEVETLKPHAAKWQQMDAYLTQHDLAPEDVNLLLGVGAALRRGDFKAFRDGVMPYVELCNQHLGLALPADLQARVDQGDMTAEAATELSVARLNNARLSGQAQATAQATQAAQQQEAQRQMATTVSSAVTNWESEIRSRDPDYAKKMPTVMRISQALMAEFGQPQTAEAAVAMAKRAYDETNAMFARVLPAPVATRPSPVGVHQVNHVRAEPRTMMDAAMAALDRMRA